MKRNSYHEIGSLSYKVKKAFERGFDYKFWLYRFKWHMASKFKILPKFPIHLDIEATDSCNIKCIMCIHSYESNLNTGFIDMSLAKKIIDEGAENGLYSVKFNWRGEPLLHTKIVDLVRYAKQKSIIDVQFNTNGLPLNEKRIRELIEAGLDRIIFSVDGATKETYEKIRVGASYDRLVSNIKMVAAIKKEKGSKTPFVRVQMVKMKDTVKEVEDFVNMWSGIVDHIAIEDYDSRDKMEKLHSVDNYEPTGRICCIEPWRRMAITWDGKILMCCGDWYLKNILGDAKVDSVKSVWLGEKMQKIRMLQKQNHLNEIAACKDCFVIESYNWNGVDKSVKK